MSNENSKSVSDYAKAVFRARNDYNTLADLHIEIASQYAFLSEQMKDVKIKKAGFWKIKLYEGEKQREKPLSDTFVESLWRISVDGADELRLKYALDSFEKLMSAIKSSIVVNSIEIRNQ